MIIRPYTESDHLSWNSYVDQHPEATNCHLPAWRDIIQQTYGHKNYYLLAEDSSQIMGILPLIHVRSLLFGSTLVSMPFLNYGGILADNPVTEEALLDEAIKIAGKLKANNIELRQLHPLHCSDSHGRDIVPSDLSFSSNSSRPDDPTTQRPNDPVAQRPDDAVPLLSTNKVRMLLELPDSSDDLLRSFKSKLRSQINRPIKEGMEAIVGGAELLDDFYAVFSENMRDLGSPVHSRLLFANVLHYLDGNAKLVVVKHRNRIVASALILLFKDVFEVPWASSLRQYNSLSPNMLLYWTMLEFASNRKYHYFDFGRSTPGEGTARFKEQWGAKQHPLFWYSAFLKKGRATQSAIGSESKRDLAEAIWQKLPISFANWIGPRIRSGIPL